LIIEIDRHKLDTGGSACNPNYLEGWGGSRLETGLGNSLQDPISMEKSWMWWHAPVIVAMAKGIK
jgi:hypothetical protein